MPVLLESVLEGLRIKKDGLYVDGTFGRGGHSSAILNELSAKGRLLAIDRDPQAIASATAVLKEDPRFDLAKGEIADIEQIMAKKCGTSRDAATGKVDGILFDLGVSSPQLDDAERGFSFLRDGPLDMRMDPDKGLSATDYLAKVTEMDLRTVLKKYGEETHATRIARAIAARRVSSPVQSTRELADIVSAAVPAKLRAKKKHPATKTFQAIRIAVNDELGQLELALEQSLTLLKKGGRLCVISFHSLEDRIVKRFMRSHSLEAEQYRGMPNVPEQFRPQLKTIGRAIVADDDEIAVNARSRSARLRVAEKIS